jgi:hypothetical protein
MGTLVLLGALLVSIVAIKQRRQLTKSSFQKSISYQFCQRAGFTSAKYKRWRREFQIM